MFRIIETSREDDMHVRLLSCLLLSCLLVDKGLAKFVGRENEIAAPLNVCLEKAEKQIPLQVESATPIYMSGTAGMR